MRILMLGNSYTACNGLPEQLARLTGAEVIAHTRGGARLAEQCNPQTKLGARTLAALQQERWDFVILQEMSHAPATAPEAFYRAVQTLCEKIRASGAVPVLFATWAYAEGGKALARLGMTYEEMAHKMHSAYAEAARRNHARLADVGAAFDARRGGGSLYAPDGSHPNAHGTSLAAEILAQTILQD